MEAKKTMIALVVIYSMLFAACNSVSAWPTIIATAEAISSITGVADPALASYSQLAVQLLQTADNAVTAYNANKNAGTLAAAEAAIQAVEVQLPAELQKLNLSPSTAQMVSAAVNIILDYVEALAVKAPALSDSALNHRAKRTTAPVPKPLTHAQIVQRWDNEVCHMAPACIALVH